MLNFKTNIFVFLSFISFSALTAGPLLAARVASLYDVEIAVPDESSDSRQLAFTQGLNELFIRISGDSAIMSKLKRPPSSRYVQQFSYRPAGSPVTGQNGEVLDQLLKIQFNGNRLEKYLLDNGFAVWGEHRSDVVIWMTIRDGRNEYVLKDSDVSLLKTAMDDALMRRGIPRHWPLNDYKDQKNLKVADIRGGFKDPLTKASRRYGNGPILAGSMIWNGQRWQSSWSLLTASTEQYWSLVDSDYHKLINSAVNSAADTMGQIYAVKNIDDSQPLAVVQLDVQSINSITKYHLVEDYLNKLTAVKNIFPLIVNGQSVVFQITLRSEQEDFLNLINNDAQLLKVEPVKHTGTLKATELSSFESAPQSSSNAGITTTAAVPASDAQLPVNQIPKFYYRLLN